MSHWRLCVAMISTGLVLGLSAPLAAEDFSPRAARAAVHRAVTFFREHCSAGGGYVYIVSADLSMRKGEEPVSATTAWTQPPGTPAVGQAYLDAYKLTGDPLLLEAAKETAKALERGQLVSGGWDNSMEFDPEQRRQHAYRVDMGDRRPSGKLRNTTTFDDNKSQSAARFLMALDAELKFEDAALHEAVLSALTAFEKAQYPNGAWPQRYSSFPVASEFPVLQASMPSDWPREHTGVKYGANYTLNDGAISDLIATFLDAYDIYGDERYLATARRGGDFFLLAQLPEPQPGWAQQYDQEMHPVWARKFEPPAVTGGESQSVMQSLILLYRRTGDRKYLEPLPRAIDYYRRSLLPNGELARFYELGTNKPLYFTRAYVLTYDDSDLPTHYGFKVPSRLDRLGAQLTEVERLPVDQLWQPARRKAPKPSSSLSKRAEAVARGLDDRGAWVEPGTIRDLQGHEHNTDVISSKTFIKNLTTLAEYLGANK
ncbi:MAG: pectate lyase [Planctomycetaceae bacterium]